MKCDSKYSPIMLFTPLTRMLEMHIKTKYNTHNSWDNPLFFQIITVWPPLPLHLDLMIDSRVRRKVLIQHFHVELPNRCLIYQSLVAGARLSAPSLLEHSRMIFFGAYLSENFVHPPNSNAHFLYCCNRVGHLRNGIFTSRIWKASSFCIPWKKLLKNEFLKGSPV